MNAGAPLILLVEDDADTAALYSALLSCEGLEVVCCSKGDEARTWWERSPRRPDLVMIDVILPDMNGLDLCREITAAGRAGGGPAVMVLSAHGDPRTAGRSLRAGASAFLDKLRDLDRFVSTVQGLLGGAGLPIQ